MATFTELLARLDHSSTKSKGDQFEKICKWFLRHDPIYKAQLEDVWLWDEWPDRDGPDLGIDLVARTKDGKLWAIQAKAYDPERTLSKRDVDSFLANSARSDFAFRLILTTAKDLGRNLQKQLKTVEPPVSARVLSDLEAANVNWPESPAKLRAPRPERKKPRPHQREAIDAVVKDFTDHDRGRLVMACGTGKTLVGLWVAETLEAERTLVLLPSLSLLGQTMEEWLANGKGTPRVLAVCSDESVSRGADEWVSDTSELGIPVTTDPTEIAAFLEGPGPSLVFSTYHSSPQIAKAQKIADAMFDLALADEAHRCAGQASSDFATILKADEIRATRRLFMTATPRYFTGRVKKVAKEQEWEIASMDDEAKFGPEFHRLTFGEAIERDLLSPYQVLIIGVDDPIYAEYAAHRQLVTRDGEEITDARTLAKHIALAKAMKKYELRRVITFHSRINRAKEFADEFPQVVDWMQDVDGPDGDIWCDHVSGKMRTNQRKARLDRLREVDGGGRGLLANAKCLGEGVDVPTLDGVAFIDPRRSQTDIVQNVGRAIRKAEDKTVGTIVLPVFIDSGADPETAVEDSAFKPVWDVLRALRDHDEDLGEWLDSLRRGMARRGIDPAQVWDRRIALDLPTSVGEAFIRAFKTRLVEQTTESWEFWFELLTRFTEREGHTLVSQNHLESDYALGNWVANQRRQWRRKGLSPSRTARLEAVPGWVWNEFEIRWDDAFTKLETFASREGHCRVIGVHKEGDFLLGKWVQHQRSNRSAGLLSDARIARLESLPGWMWDVHGSHWDKGFETLSDYLRSEGHLRVPVRASYNGFKLGNWVTVQRRYWAEGRLTDEQVRRLEKVPGWVWDQPAADWEEAFAVLKAFVAREQVARVPKRHNEGDFALGQWVLRQRRARRAGQLSSNRTSRLEALPGWVWDELGAMERDGFSSLDSFIAREGHARVPSGHVERGFSLGNWVSNQRARHRNGKLSESRIAELESKRGWVWGVREARWEEAFRRLEAFVEQFGHSRVTVGFVDSNLNLGQWVANQRAIRRRGDLSTDRATRLEALPGWVWDARNEK